MTVSKLWNDPYISKKMLEHHLSFDDNIASRKFETIQKTVDYIYQKYTPKTLCDFGCGPGLYTNLFHKKNVEVSGVDFSTNSIAYARSKNDKINYVESNYLEVDLKQKFDVITMIYCDFSVLPLEGIKILLDTVKRHLNENGKFLFDVHNYTLFDNFPQEVVKEEQVDGFYMEGPCKIKTEFKKYDKFGVCLQHIKAKGHREIELYNWYQCYTPKSITKILEEYGFEVLDISDNTLGQKGVESDSIFIEAKMK